MYSFESDLCQRRSTGLLATLTLEFDSLCNMSLIAALLSTSNCEMAGRPLLQHGEMWYSNEYKTFNKKKKYVVL